MSSMTAHRHPETLFSLLMLPVAPTWEESDSDDKETQPPSLDRRLTSQPSPSIVSIARNVDGFLKKISFTTVITETLSTGLVSGSTFYFREKLAQMFEWTNPIYDAQKIGDFYILCDRSMTAYFQTLGDNVPAHLILIGMAAVKVISLFVIVYTAGLSIWKKGMTVSISKFIQILKQITIRIVKFMFNNASFLYTVKTIACDRVFENLTWLEQNPEMGYAQHLLSLPTRVRFNDFLKSVNYGHISELMQYVEVWHIEAIKSGLNRKTNSEIFKVIQTYYPAILASTVTFFPALAPLMSPMINTAIGGVSTAGTAAGVGQLFWAARYSSMAATMEPSGNQGDWFNNQPGDQPYNSQWPTQPELDDSDELTLESTEDDTEDDTEDLRCLSDDAVRRALQFLSGEEDFDEEEANREEVLIRP
jgi:hypothetical protein